LPKGKGRMKQERSQLNVRIPTALKRRASAKAVLEGRDIGEVVEELLREYLEK
jgi:predicted HicB family RNase H-like nuclease